jgi:DNA repair exonuclease SbcCD ATPase subunit
MLLGRLRTALDAIAEKDAVIVGNQFSAEQSRLTRKVTEARDAYSRISEESYIAALRGRIDKEIQLTEASIRRQVALYEFQSQRNATLDEHADRVSSRLDELLATMGTTESTFPGTVQVLVDRITSLRLELEDRIPEERLQIERRINEGMAEQDRLAAILSQQKLEAQNFDADLAARQSVALDAIAAAESALAMLEARKDARLVHQPTSIVEELTVVRPDDNRLIKTLAILVFGGLCSLLSAYALEALRLARLGTLAG